MKSGKLRYMNRLLVSMLLAVFCAWLVPQGRGEHRARPAEAFVDSIGVNTHLGYSDTIYKDYESIIKPRLLELGVRHIRDGTFNDDVARKYLELGSNGVRLLLITDSRKALQQAERVGPVLFALEGMNEPDLRENWIERTRAEQAALYAAVKSNPAIRHLPVLVSSMANVRHHPARLGDLSAHLEFGNMHPYAAGQPPSRHWGWGTTMEQAMGEARKVSGDKPIIVSECGYHNRLEEKGHPGATETAVAKYLPRLFAVHFNRGITRSYAYEFADEKPDPQFQDKEQHFGLVRRDGSVKPAFTALKNLIALLSDPGPAFPPGSLDFALRGQINQVHHTLLQKRDGRFYLVLWQEAVNYDIKTKQDVAVPDAPVTLTFAHPIQQARLFRPNRGTSPLVDYAAPRLLSLAVPDELLVVEITPSREITVHN